MHYFFKILYYITALHGALYVSRKENKQNHHHHSSTHSDTLACSLSRTTPSSSPCALEHIYDVYVCVYLCYMHICRPMTFGKSEKEYPAEGTCWGSQRGLQGAKTTTLTGKEPADECVCVCVCVWAAAPPAVAASRPLSIV